MALRSLRRKLPLGPSARLLVESSACSSIKASLGFQSCTPSHMRPSPSILQQNQGLSWRDAVGQSRYFRSSPLSQKDIEVEIQSMGESISEGTIAEILKKEGDAVEEDETIAQIETDKVTVDVKAPSAGKLSKLQVSVDDTVKVGQVVAIISEGAGGEGTEKSGSTEPSEEQNEEHHEAAGQKQQEASSQEESKAEGPPRRQSSIKFPQRMADGERISEMPESKRPGKSVKQEPSPPPAKETQIKTSDPGKGSPPKKSQPWYVGKEQGTKLSQSRVLTQREMEQIELGGAEP